MKVKRMPVMERQGAHLMQLGVDHWALVGRESVTLRREIMGTGLRWVVSSGNVQRSNWQTTALAFAHAYALATGHSEI